MTALVDVRHDAAHTTIRLTRAERRNALSHALVDAVGDAARAAAARGHAVAVLQADPPVFCAGADLEEFRADPEAVPATVRLLDLLVRGDLLWTVVVEGDALGAAVAVAAVAPLVVAADDAAFRLPEVDLGIYPGGVLGYLEEVMGIRAAHDLARTGAPMTAAMAAERGLVTEVVAPGEARPRAEVLAEEQARRPALARRAATAWTSRFRSPEFTARHQLLDALVEVPDPARSA